MFGRLDPGWARWPWGYLVSPTCRFHPFATSSYTQRQNQIYARERGKEFGLPVAGTPFQIPCFMGSFSHEMNPLSSSSRSSSSRIGLLGGSRREGKAALMVVSLPLLAICSAHNIFIIHSLQSYTTPLFSTTSRSQRALRD